MYILVCRISLYNCVYWLFHEVVMQLDLIVVEILHCENFDLENIVTPVNTDALERLLNQSNYDRDKTQFLLDGFRNGFSIGYEGPENVQQTAQTYNCIVALK